MCVHERCHCMLKFPVTLVCHLLTVAVAGGLHCFTGTWKPGCEIRMLYDGECSLCMKEVNFLRKRDAAAGRIDFVDIALPSYRPEDNAGAQLKSAGGDTEAKAAMLVRAWHLSGWRPLACKNTPHSIPQGSLLINAVVGLLPPHPSFFAPHRHHLPAGHGAHPRHPARRHHCA